MHTESTNTSLDRNQTSKTLRIGLLLNDLEVDAWVHMLVKDLTNSTFADISLVVLNDNPRTSPVNRSIISKITNNRGRFTYLLVRKFFEEVYSKIVERTLFIENAEAPVSLEDLVDGVPLLKLKTETSKYSDRFYASDIETIKSSEIDVLFRVGFGILRGDILSAARYGVWSFHHGDNRINRGGPAGFWESMESWPVTGSVLQILNEDLDNGSILYRSFSSTQSLSVKDNKSNYYWKSQAFLRRKLQELHAVGADEFFKNVAYENRHISMYSERLYVAPTNLELAKLTINKVLEKVKVLFHNQFYRDQWILMFDLKSEFSTSLWRYKEMIPPQDRFWADPHVLYRDGRYYIFIEEYIYDTGKGHISLIEMDCDGNFDSPVKILDLPYHLSYPYVFENEGECYMIPESMDNGTIELYKCTAFPNTWEFQCNLMSDVKALDTTLHYHDGKWWMFTTMVETDGASSWDELFVFYSEDLYSNNWISHPKNPVVSDCRSARPAGKLFIENDILYRPSQDCSLRYGRGFNLNEITVLTEDNYEENVVTKVLPNWDKKILGTHTFNKAENLNIVDAIRRHRLK